MLVQEYLIKIKNTNLNVKIKPQIMWSIKTYKIAYVKIHKIKIYNQLCQTYSPNVV